mmetsp:Transcript_72525/g.208155  ORF Transcript_72525/g.208155 Transcript_72525/m.208155 type:complete len:224 (+) Transcript_72525:86-757(+)
MVLTKYLSEALEGQWQVGMLNAPSSAPATCCYALWCIPCVTYNQRLELLDITQEKYMCCAGLCNCCCFGSPCDSHFPWLCLEVCCCSSQAIVANRFMLQTRFDRKNDACDNCLMITAGCCDLVASISNNSGGGQDPDARWIMDVFYASVCACMLTQQAVELEHIKKELESKPYSGVPEHIMNCFGSAAAPAQLVMHSGSENASYGAAVPAGAPVIQGVPVGQR